MTIHDKNMYKVHYIKREREHDQVTKKHDHSLLCLTFKMCGARAYENHKKLNKKEEAITIDDKNI